MNEPEIPTILLVEGEIVVRHPLAEYLRECGYRVFEASSGEEARAALESGDVSFDVVLADMQTSGSGFVLRQWLREHQPSLQVILTGSIEKAVTSAADVCEEGPALVKPYEHRLVLDRIRELLGRRNHHRDPS